MRTVLIVDDNAEVLRSMRRLLASLGWRAEVASSAMEALLVLRRSSVSVVVTDYFLAMSEDGDWLRARIAEEFPGTPVILTTGLPVADAIRARFESVLPKPIDPAALVRLLNGFTTNGGAHV